MAEEKGVWRTIRGTHVFIRDGESAEDALNRTIAKQNEDKKQEQISKHKEVADKLNGKSVDSQKVKNIVHKSEDIIRADEMESVYVFDTDGNQKLVKTSGLPDRVDLSPEDVKLLQDSIFTHNHPNDSIFSRADIDTAFEGGVKEFRACFYGVGAFLGSTKRLVSGAYVLTRNFEIGDEIPSYYSRFGYNYVLAKKQYIQEVTDPIYEKNPDSVETIKLCNKMVNDFQRKWLRENAKKYGWTYTEEFE